MLDINEMRIRIQAMLRRVPPYISTANVQAVREFKKWHAKALKESASSKPSVLEDLLTQTIQKYSL